MRLKLVDKVKQAKDCYSFIFEPEKKVTYLPGQYFYLTIDKLVGDYRGPTRHFTISSSPTEEFLGITTNIRDISKFKNELNNLKIGQYLNGEGPNGTFILDESDKGNHVLIAGGIGITPFRSFAKYNVDNGLTNTNLHIVHSSKTPESAIFMDQMMQWANKHENITYDLTVSRPEESEKTWKGLTGRIDKRLLSKLFDNWGLGLGDFKVWLCGPPSMVTGMEFVLKDLGIKGKNVISEKFTGY